MPCTFDCIMRCAIVGSGLASLAAYATLRHGGVEPGEIAVFGPDEDPTTQWRTRAAAIRQRRMRSESEGHLAPASFPGLAVREALRRATPMPLFASVANRYHPSVDDFLAHAEESGRAAAGSRASACSGSRASAPSPAASSSTATGRSHTCSSRPATRVSHGPQSCRTPCTRTSRTTTTRVSRSSAPGWRRPPSG